MTGAVGAGALASRPGDTSPQAATDEIDAGGTPLASPFDDVPDGSEGLSAMVWAAENQVQPALDARTYAPAAAVTRGDVAVALHRFAGSPAVPVKGMPPVIADLGENPDSAPALLWLHGRGALWGDSALKVHPEDPATLDSTASLLTALLRPALAGIGATWDPSAQAPLPQDAAPGSGLADALWLTAAGMATGSRTASDWVGDEGVTRADLAMVLHQVDSVITDALA